MRLTMLNAGKGSANTVHVAHLHLHGLSIDLALAQLTDQHSKAASSSATSYLYFLYCWTLISTWHISGD